MTRAISLSPSENNVVHPLRNVLVQVEIQLALSKRAVFNDTCVSQSPNIGLLALSYTMDPLHEDHADKHEKIISSCQVIPVSISIKVR